MLVFPRERASLNEDDSRENVCSTSKAKQLQNASSSKNRKLFTGGHGWVQKTEVTPPDGDVSIEFDNNSVLGRNRGTSPKSAFEKL
jgi:hypothetical protein